MKNLKFTLINIFSITTFLILFTGSIYGDDNLKNKNSKSSTSNNNSYYSLGTTFYVSYVNNIAPSISYNPNRMFDIGVSVSFPFQNNSENNKNYDPSTEVFFNHFDFFSNTHAFKSSFSLGYDPFLGDLYIGCRQGFSKKLEDGSGYEFGVMERIHLIADKWFQIFPYLNITMFTF